MQEIPIDRQNATGRLVATGEAARMLNLSTSGVRSLAERGVLPVEEKLPGNLGAYLFKRSDVAALATKRLAEQKARLEKAERELKGEVA